MRHLLLAAIVSTGAWAWAGSASAQDAAAGAIVFKTQCAGCHSVDEGKNIVGPSLFGIVGREAGQVPGFKYSPANKASGKTWDEATLDAYITNPQAVVPKTIMPYPGLKDATQRANLIAFLATAK
nr:c-type cytochrome [uncultured Rhodopila sp.]